MLTKKDVREIMIDALGEFFETVLSPYFDHEHKESQKMHQEIKKEIRLIGGHIGDHEKRISRMEALTSVQ